MTEDDYFTDEMIYNLLADFSDSVEAVSASESIGSADVKKGKNSSSVNVSGVSQGYFTANEVTMLAGTKFTTDEFTEGRTWP